MVLPASDFANRLRKNARHLAKWAKRSNITCWRVYDRDIPEVPVTVDTYEGALVINDFRIDPSNEAWLDELFDRDAIWSVDQDQPVVRVEASRSFPSTALAWSLYGDPTRAEELVRRARCGTPLFMPATFEAVSPQSA